MADLATDLAAAFSYFLITLKLELEGTDATELGLASGPQGGQTDRFRPEFSSTADDDIPF